MARVKFTEDFDYKPTARITIGYLAGMEMTVKRECAEQAIAARKAIRVKRVAEVRDGEAKSGG